MSNEIKLAILEDEYDKVNELINCLEDMDDFERAQEFYPERTMLENQIKAAQRRIK